MDKQIITFTANEQNLVRIGGEYHYSSNKVSYIGAHFDLGANWDGFDSVRAVWFTDRINGISTVLDGEGNCTVPTEVLKKKDRVFVNLVGSIVSNGELTDRLTTYPAVALVVDSKAKVDSTETAPVTPSQFEQFVSIVQDAVANIKDIVSTTLNADYTLTFVYSDGTSYTTPSIRGERGPQGADGADGTDGNGIASAVLNSNYTLTLTFTDGTSYTTPSIRGAQGPKGDPGDVSRAQLDAAVSDLKSEIDEIAIKPENIFDGTFVVGEQVATSSGAFVEGSSYARTNHIAVKKGVVNVGVSASEAVSRVVVHYALYDANKTKLSTGSYSGLTVLQVNGMYYVQIPVAQNGYFAFDSYSTTVESFRDWYVSQVQSPTGFVSYFEPHINSDLVEVDATLTEDGVPADAKATGEKIESLDDMLLIKRQNISESVLDLTWTTGKYMAKSGAVSNNSSYMYSMKIPVSEGDVLSRNSTLTFRYVTAFNGNTAYTDKGAESVSSYTVPNGIDYVVVSVLTASDYVLKRTVTETIMSYAENAISTMYGGILANVKSAELASGEGLYISRNSLIRNKSIVFKANVSGTDWSVTVAHGVVDSSYDADTYSNGFIITPTTVTPISNMNDGVGGTLGTPWTHNLTISDRLCVVLSVDDMQMCTVTLMSENGKASNTFTSQFQGRKGSIYAKVNSGTFANCILTFACSDIEKPIWLFGNSYVSMVNNRYPYWLKQIGADNCLINSYPGEASINALKDFRELIKIGSPKYIIWGLGMNDHDSANAVNADWLACVTEVINVCEKMNITPILTTVPNVTHTSYNNVQKNAWVRSHEYRYIDFATAIGAAEEVGAEWPEGWLSSDNVHPTEMGARVLAMQAVADAPELLQP